MRARLLWLAFAAGCKSAEPGKVPDDEPVDTDTPPGPDTDAPVDTDLPADTDDTGTTSSYGAPTRLEVACEAAGNALRSWCTVTVEPAQPVELTYARADGLSAARTVAGDDVAVEHVLPVYFLAPEQAYDLTAIATAWPDQPATGSLTSGTPPVDAGSSLAITGASTMGLIGTHDPCGMDPYAVIYDTTTGDLVWYELMDPGTTFGANDMVAFTTDHTVLGESRGDVVEVDLMGTDLVRFDDLDDSFGITAGGPFGNFHHDITKHDGVYYVFYQQTYAQGILDVVLLFDGAGAELARWYPDQHLPLPPNWGDDFLHTNSVDVDPNGDIVLSWLTQDTVAKIEGDWTSPDFGTVLWALDGDGGSVLGTLTADWSAVGAPADFDGQHSANIRPDGRLQLLDNDHGRGLVISIDEVAGTATIDAEYETREGFCGPQGTSRSTLAGNAIVGCAGDWIREYDGVTGAQLWEAEVQCLAGGGGFGDGSSRWYPLDGW